MDDHTTTGVLAQKVDPDRIPRIALANLYPEQVWYFLATFIALVAACHALSTLYAYLTRNHPPPRSTPSKSNDAEAEEPGVGHVSLTRLPIALLNLFRTVAFRWSVVILGSYTINVADFFLAGMYITVLFTWTFINSANHFGVKYDPKYWANRCSHIAATQLPLMTAFGMKNNFISFLSGVSFDKLEHLHRISARVIAVMFWVHGFGRVSHAFVCLLTPATDLNDDMETYWFRIGVAAASAFTLLCILSVRPLRSRNHEAFMYIHLTMGVITLAGTYIHANEFGYGVYIWPSMFLWGLDRFLRLVRIAFVNSPLFPLRRAGDVDAKSALTSSATVTLLSPHFVRILVDAPAYFLWRWRPGQSAYITIIGAYPTSITEAHPFTIADVIDGREVKPGHGSMHVAAGSTEKESSEDGNSSGRDGVEKSATKKPRLMFIVRVREGFTRQLVDSVLAKPDSNTGVSRAFKALIDGPYSSPPNVRGFETVLFICGGSGVSFALPLFLDLISASHAGHNPCCQRIVFVWAIRDPDQINWIAEAVTHVLAGRDKSTSNFPAIDIRLHVTTAVEDTQSFEGEDRPSQAQPADAEFAGGKTVVGTDPNPNIARAEKIDPTAKDRFLAVSGVQLIYGRPEIKAIIQTEIKAPGARGGAISVNVCGTLELAHSVRRAMSGRVGERFIDVLRGGPSVSLHVEGFGNA
ncbi:Ferric/cupric reductase transmembrane component 1 [Favolaschia claudopus]|uniref:Ferric/cupric reductase transmembrane component 1 n=1 Tax=Favolaschia claudopus TaxID=2862362 RepID=A0AAV9ZF53_9AGAR